MAIPDERPDTMTAWVAATHGPPSQILRQQTIETPDPGPGFVRVRVDAAALGLPDVLMCRGAYPLTPSMPFTPGQEIVGVVTATGRGVDRSLLGTRQMGVTAFYLGAGGFADEALAAAATIHPAPDDLDDTTAAGFHIPFHTAWIGLADRARIQEGETLVVLGAAGGSGSAAVLLGRALGARVIAVVGGAEKTRFCEALGANEVIDHREHDVTEEVRRLTAGAGADVVFDPVGGDAGEDAAKVTAGGGRFLLVGFASGRWPALDPARVVQGNFSVVGVYAGAYDRAHATSTYGRLFGLMREGRLGSQPVETVDFDDVPSALERLADRRAVGKLVMLRRAGSQPT